MWRQEQWGLMIKQSSLWFWRNFGSSNLFICLLKNLLPSLWTAGLLETTILLVNTPAESAGTLAGSYSRPQDYLLHQRRGWKNVRLWHKDENVTPLVKFRRKNSLGVRAWIADWFGCEIHRGGHGGREEGADKGITPVWYSCLCLVPWSWWVPKIRFPCQMHWLTGLSIAIKNVSVEKEGQVEHAEWMSDALQDRNFLQFCYLQ